MYSWLTPEQFADLTQKACHYCGATPGNVISAYPGFRYNGLDRVDNDQSYSRGNVVPCCKRCNSMKSSLPAGEFIAHVRRIAEHQKI